MSSDPLTACPICADWPPSGAMRCPLCRGTRLGKSPRSSMALRHRFVWLLLGLCAIAFWAAVIGLFL